MSEVQEISLEELVLRVRTAAGKMGKKNPNRLLLFNAALVLESLGQQLEKAWAEQKPVAMLHLPEGGMHRVN